MSTTQQMLIQVMLILWITGSPFAFLYFHKKILGQIWDNDLADRVTIFVYFFSNAICGFLSWMIQECNSCR